MKKKVAIIGAGFAGLGVCYHLLSSAIKDKYRVTLFDEKGIGGGASSAAAGLMHPFFGAKLTLCDYGYNAMSHALSLLQLCGSDVYENLGITKLFYYKQQKTFDKKLIINPFLHHIETDKNIFKQHYKAIRIFPGINVYVARYIKKLSTLCFYMGMQFIQQKVYIQDLYDFDYIIVCAGRGIENFNFNLQLSFNKGAGIICKKPPSNNLEKAVITNGYITFLDSNRQNCYLGTTYDSYLDNVICKTSVKEEIFSKLSNSIHNINHFVPKYYVWGVRVFNSIDSRPLLKFFHPNIFVVTGLGSKGLLYHSYLGRLVSTCINNLL